MKPRPLYRSLTFWSGILVMLFLAWAWWHSLRHFTSVGRGDFRVFNGGAHVTLHGMRELHPGGFQYQRSSLKLSDWSNADHTLWGPPAWIRGQGGDPSIYHPPKPPWTFADQMRAEMIASEKGSWMLILPYWLIVSAVALPWSGMLFWRARHIRRAVAIAQG